LFFFKRPKRKKRVTVAASSKRKCDHQQTVPAATAHVEEVVILQDGDSGPEDEDDAAAVEEEDLTPHGDAHDGREAHDEAVLKTICGQAICLMKDKGVTIEDAEEKMALQLFPQVSWLARQSIARLTISCYRLQVSHVACIIQQHCKKSLKN
jgi:hypothetical protein